MSAVRNGLEGCASSAKQQLLALHTMTPAQTYCWQLQRQLQTHTRSASSSSAVSPVPGASSWLTNGASSYSAASSSCRLCLENRSGMMYCLMGTRAMIITGNMTPTICSSSHTYQPAPMRSHKASGVKCWPVRHKCRWDFVLGTASLSRASRVVGSLSHRLHDGCRFACVTKTNKPTRTLSVRRGFQGNRGTHGLQRCERVV